MFKKLFSRLFGCSCGCSRSSSSEGGLHDVECFVDYVVRNLVDAPNDVTIRTEEADDVFNIRIFCREDDRGKIIGRRGKTINAIRALANGAAGRLQKKVTVEVLDD